MSEKKLNWGLLSTARINRALIPAIRSVERAELVAVASRSQASAEAYAAEWGILTAFGSYQAMLDSDKIDTVYISLPNSMHAEWAVRAAEAGKHVLCEKPLALTIDECAEIRAAAEGCGVVIAEAVMYLYHPLMQRMRELVQDGIVGEVQMVRGAFSFPLDRPNDVRWKPELGGGSLWDVGSYPVSFIRFLCGEPDEVFGWAQWVESGVDGGFAGLLKYEDGPLGLFDSGFCHQYRVEAEVVGNKGRLTLEQPYAIREQSCLVLNQGDERTVIEVPKWVPNGYHYEVEAVTAAVLDGVQLPVPLTSSCANVATLAALYASARLGGIQQVRSAP